MMREKYLSFGAAVKHNLRGPFVLYGSNNRSGKYDSKNNQQCSYLKSQYNILVSITLIPHFASRKSEVQIFGVDNNRKSVVFDRTASRQGSTPIRQNPHPSVQGEVAGELSGLICLLIRKILFGHFAFKQVVCPYLITNHNGYKQYDHYQHNFQSKRT